MARVTTEQQLPRFGCRHCGVPYNYLIENGLTCEARLDDGSRRDCQGPTTAYSEFFAKLEEAWRVRLYSSHRREILNALDWLQRRAKPQTTEIPKRKSRGRPSSPELDETLRRLINVYCLAREDRNKAANVVRRANGESLLPFAPDVPIELTVKNDVAIGNNPRPPLAAGLLFLKRFMPEAVLPAHRSSDSEIVYDADGEPDPVNFLRRARSVLRSESSAARTRAGQGMAKWARSSKKPIRSIKERPRFLRVRNVSQTDLQGRAPNEVFVIAAKPEASIGDKRRGPKPLATDCMDLLPDDIYWRKRLAEGAIVIEPEFRRVAKPRSRS
jgi:hypothetical protein